MMAFISIMRSHISISLTYKMNILFGYISDILYVVLKCYLWLAIANSNPNFAGETNYIITYFIFVSIIMQLTGNRLTIASNILEGSLSNWLLKPFSIFKYELAQQLGRVVMTASRLWIIILAIVVFMSSYIAIWDYNYLVGILFLVLGFFVSFYIALVIQLFAFWLMRVEALQFIYTMFVDILSGGMIPYKYMPAAIKNIAELLPFKFIIQMPIAGFTNTLSSGEIMSNVAMALAYIAALHFIAAFIFKKGLKKYTAMGG